MARNESPFRNAPLVIGFDADDTLWHSEDGFDATHKAFTATLRSVRPDLTDDEIVAELDRTERANMALLGYGVKAYTISMVEAALTLGGPEVRGHVIADIVTLGRRLLERPTELLDGVADTLALLAEHHPLLLITKGDLLHQERKVHESGLDHLFAAVEIVTEKDPDRYLQVLARHGVAPERFVMVGNSVKSDVLPVLSIGGRAVHIPYEFTWTHEVATHQGDVPELASIADLPAYIADLYC